jgi:cold shock CspA family protein
MRMEVAVLRTGRMLRFDEVRGYGFISPDAGGEDVFVHANDLLNDKNAFTPGTPVEFEVIEAERGLKALAVRLVGKEPARGYTGAEARSTGPAPGSTAGSTAGLVSGSMAGGVADDALCDVLSPGEFLQEFTELLLEADHTLTALQITQLRQRLLKNAQEHGWVDG